MIPDDQVIRFTRAGECEVAWSAVGSGPPVVMGGWWSSHLVQDWAIPEFRHFVGRLAEHRTVIRYDTPGTGMSRSGVCDASTVEEHIRALGAVVEAAAGGATVSLLGGSSGSAIALAYAAEHRVGVDRLVLYGGFLRGSDIAAPGDRAAMIELVRSHWGISSRVLSDIFLPEATSVQRKVLAQRQRHAATADEAATTLAGVYALDASAWAPRVTAPTLVLHRREDRAIRFGLGRDLAEHITDAAFEPLEGTAHFPWFGDSDDVIDRVLTFLGVHVPHSPHTATAPTASLTGREREIMALVAAGLTDTQIAARLQLSAHTVHRHVANVRAKLGVPSRAAAAAAVATSSDD